MSVNSSIAFVVWYFVAIVIFAVAWEWTNNEPDAEDRTSIRGFMALVAMAWPMFAAIALVFSPLIIGALIAKFIRRKKP